MRIKTYNEEIIRFPEHDIAAVEGYTENVPVQFTIIFNKKDKDYRLRVLSGPDNVEYCKSKKGDVIFDTQNNPLFKVHDGIFSSKIYKGENKNEILATVKPKDVSKAREFTIEYFNQAIDNTEVLEMNCDRFLCSGGIFQGKEEENSPMVSKIIEIMNVNVFESSDYSKYIVDIAPNVDKLLILALAVFFIHKRNKIYLTRHVRT